MTLNSPFIAVCRPYLLRAERTEPACVRAAAAALIPLVDEMPAAADAVRNEAAARVLTRYAAEAADEVHNAAAAADESARQLDAAVRHGRGIDHLHEVGALVHRDQLTTAEGQAAAQLEQIVELGLRLGQVAPDVDLERRRLVLQRRRQRGQRSFGDGRCAGQRRDRGRDRDAGRRGAARRGHHRGDLRARLHELWSIRIVARHGPDLPRLTARGARAVLCRSQPSLLRHARRRPA